MATCINRSALGYSGLLAEFGTVAKTDAVIRSWQKSNNSEEFPSVLEAVDYSKARDVIFRERTKNFDTSLFANLIEIGAVYQYKNAFYLSNKNAQNQVSAEVAKRNYERINTFLAKNKIVKDSVSFELISPSTYRIVLNESALNQNDLAAIDQSINSNNTQMLIEKLVAAFPGLNVQTVTAKQAERYYNTLDEAQKAKVPFDQVKSYYVNGQVFLIAERVTDMVALEEVLHPFVDALKIDNKELFDNLLSEARASFPELNEQIEESYSNRRGFTQEHRDVELVTQALAEHFAKETKDRGPKTFAFRVMEMLKWLRDIIADIINNFRTGAPVSLASINTGTNLTDIARLLNTPGLTFDVTSMKIDNRVKYALTPEKQEVIDYNRRKAETDQQRATLDKLTHQVIESEQVIGSISASKVTAETPNDITVLDEKTHTYFNLSKPAAYTSATTVIKGKLENEEEVQLNLDIGNDVDTILDGLCSDKSYEELRGKMKVLEGESFARAYQAMQTALVEMTRNGEIAIPQVVLHDDAAGIAGTADILLIEKDGSIRVVDLKTSKRSIRDNYDKTQWEIKDSMLADTGLITQSDGVARLSTEGQHSLQVNMYRRMLLNMGYRVSMKPSSTFHVKVEIEGKGTEQVFKGGITYEGEVQHNAQDQQLYLDALLPINIDVYQQRQLEEQLNEFGSSNVDFDQASEYDLPEDQAAIAQEEYDALFGLLTNFNKALLSKRALIETLKRGISVSKDKKATLENIDKSTTLIALMLQKGDVADMSVEATRLLRDIIVETQEFIDYLEEEANFTDPEYISYVMNMKKFLKQSSNLLNSPRERLNSTQRALLDTFSKQVEKLGGNKALEEDGLLDTAILDAVKGVIKNWSSRNFTEAELDEILQKAEDVGMLRYQTMDLATSKDTLLAIMDKIVKSKKQLIQDRIEARRLKIVASANALLELDPNKNRQELYNFMLSFKDGEPTGRIIQKIGNKYYEIMDSLREELYEDGVPKQYIENPKTKADLDYNKDLAQKKAAYSNFWKAEEYSDGTYSDGEYHQYTPEFIEERNKYEVFKPIGKTGGKWLPKPGVSDLQYERYKLKYYMQTDSYYRALKDQYGNFTGKVVFVAEGFPVVKPEYKQVKESEAILSDKYKEMISDKSALGMARKNFYDMYVEEFEEGLLKKLPGEYQDLMTGKIPIVRKRLASQLKNRGSAFTRLYGRLSRSADAIRDLFTTTTEQRAVKLDENGKIIANSLPIFFVGNVSREKDATMIQDKIDALQEKRKAGNIKSEEYKEQLAVLRGQLKKAKSGVRPNELNLDLGATLLAFSGMAENFEVMSETEDTMNALLHVIENRSYTAKGGPFQNIKTGIKDKTGAFTETGEKDSEAFIVRRAKKYMRMVYYDNDNVTKNFFDKAANGLLQYTSLSYVAFNPFGNFANYAIGRLNNSIEALGQRFFEGSSYTRAEYEYNKRVLPDQVKKLAYTAGKVGKNTYDGSKPFSKYEALAELFRMMDNQSDIREVGRKLFEGDKGMAQKFMEFGYLAQDGAEYNVQTKIGMALLIDTVVKNSETNETMSLYDAFEFDSVNQTVSLKEGFDTIVEKSGKEVKYTDDWRFQMRNKIREVNKQIHGNYAYEDRMVIQSHWVGKLAAQFHKWVVPAFNARYRSEYYDENLGWLEGRYISFFKFIKYAFGEISKGNAEFSKYGEGFIEETMRSDRDEASERQRATNKLYNTYRTLGEIGIIMTGLVLRSLLLAAFTGEDDDDMEPWLKRMRNFMLYQADRTNKELVTFIPVPGLGGLDQAYQAIKNPIAATRTLGEFGEALDMSIRTPIAWLLKDSEEEFYANSEFVYQRKPRKGELKVYKNWKDAVPILYSIQKYYNFTEMKDFYIK